MCSISTVNISKCSFESVGIMNGDYNLNCDERHQRLGWAGHWACVMLRRDLRDERRETQTRTDDICITTSGHLVSTWSLIIAGNYECPVYIYPER